MEPAKLILWTGEKHGGKTTGAFKLVEAVRNEGFTVAGLLAPSLYHNGRLIGFDAFDLQSENRAPLARSKIGTNPAMNCGAKYLAPRSFDLAQDKFTRGLRRSFADLLPDGIKLGIAALSPTATESADLVIVDEFGPLELDCRGWRKNVDSLLAFSNAVILLVVRQELIDAVKQLYRDVPSRELIAGGWNSVGQIITLLRNRRHRPGKMK